MTKLPSLRIAVFASGRGSNFRSIVKSINRGDLDAEIAFVLSNNPDPGAFEFAREENIKTIHLTSRSFSSQDEFDDKLLGVLKEHDVNLIVLAGYMKKLSPRIVKAYRNRIVNIHPALLPSFGGKGLYGLKVHESVLNYGCKVTGVTVHIVDEGYDTGPIVYQQPVEVKDDDDPETLAARVLKVEHLVYPKVLRLFAENRVKVKGRKVYIEN